MAYGGQPPQYPSQNQDMFSTPEMFHEVEERGMDSTLRIYGATGGSTPMQRPKLEVEPEVDDIPMHDFQPDGHKDPLILMQAPRPTATIGSVKTSQSVQSLHSVSSDMTHTSVLSYNQYDSWVNHPKVRENWKLVLGAGFLMVLGIVLIIAGIGIAVSPATGYHCIVIIAVGVLCFIPGGYHFIYIYCAAIGRPGFNFNDLPVLR